MKNIVLASLLGFGLISSAWATETVNIHDRVNNAQAPAHQKMVESHQKMMGNNTVSTTVPSTSYAAMNEHERAAVAHEFMNNGQSGPHQAMAEAHRRMINAG
ncbi:copper-binding protein [Klebsiella pneumoniae]|uniref:copper-binding protein n=1 Tax=Klebsiella pneumoniae TaxID=573 RepID=UPI002D1EF727|nr:copper-binding protein [Klebsiella pneumoniae]MEB4558533.1 copper-binding protein [Klebsiella pneumoniae]